MIKRIALLVVIFTLSLAAPASAAEDGVIEGRLVNGTDGGSSVANQEITLDTHLNSAEVRITTAQTDAEGNFVFNGLSTEPGYSYQAIAAFQGADYFTEWQSFNEGETSKPTLITVYNSTTSDEAIKVELLHTIIFIESDNLRVTEYFLFVNQADRTYIGSRAVTADGEKETLKFSLPEEATELQYMLDLVEHHVFSSEDGLVYTMPVPPGNMEVAYSYRVNYSSGTYIYSQMVNYPTDIADLMVQGGGAEVTSLQLTTEGVIDFEGTLFNHLSGGNFAPGEVLVVHIFGLPETNNQRTVIWVAPVLVVLSAGVTFSYLIRRKRRQAVSPVESYEQSQQRLLVELAQLDDDFEAGKIQGESYHRLRSVKKAQLIELTQEPKDKSGSG